jgi:hypothetical protein
MMLKRSTTKSQPSMTARLVRAGVASLAAASAVAALATGCLDRPVVKASPKTSNVFVDQIVQTAVDKIDLLFMIDNSVSMADKQEILKDAVPVLVNRLVTPICVDATTGAPTSGTFSKPGDCGAGIPEFNPIGDIHIGIVSSSLGAHGGFVCSTGAATDTLDDKAHLIGSMRPAPGGMANPKPELNFDVTRTWSSLGFLAWDPSGTRNGATPGIKDAGTLNTAFQDMIVATGEHGCGYEAQLESWYRFLIDPEPPATVSQINGATVRSSSFTANADGTKLVLDASGNPTCVGCDETLLAQRKAFLRPDSLVAVVLLSDENDCSIRDDGVGWFVGAQARMPKATSACDANPNAPCCRSCAQRESGPPKGCSVALTDDPVCKTVPAGQQYVTWDQLHDNPNLRCYNQHKRFGFDLLYGTDRYVDGLTKKTLPLQSHPGITVANPLYSTPSSDKAPRDPSLVFLAGIIGVPWQDIADDASLAGAGLTYLTAKELLAKDRWTALLGNPTASPPGLPTDPFMQETTDQRSGMNTIANVAITPDTGPTNKINGHEQKIPLLDDLQYACTFPLKTPKTCTNGDPACDCSPDKTGSSQMVIDSNSPLCQGGATINTQTSAKAYPGARELQVLKDLGDNAIVASICPKVSDQTSPDYGYNPAVGAIIERLKEALKGKCLPRAIQTDPVTSQVLCKVVEAQKMGCDCGLKGRAVADPSIKSAVEDQLQKAGDCGTGTQEACSTWCQCEIVQLTGSDLAACQHNQPAAPGYCYIDKAANADLVSKCPANQPQLLRFVDADAEHKTPAQGAVAFIACLGAPVGSGTDGGM